MIVNFPTQEEPAALFMVGVAVCLVFSLTIAFLAAYGLMKLTDKSNSSSYLKRGGLDCGMDTTVNEWALCDPILPKTLIDGTRSAGPLMRRRSNDGKWQYRKCSEDEAADYVSRMAW